MMLENQIPIILIGEMRKFLDLSCNVASDTVLKQNIHEFCKKQSPLQFATDERTTKNAFDHNNHMLHYMCKLIVKNHTQKNDDDSLSETDDDEDSQNQSDDEDSESPTDDNFHGRNDDDISQSQKDDHQEKNFENDDHGSRGDNGRGSNIPANSQVENSTSRVGKLAKEIGVQAGEIFGQAIEEFNTALAGAKLAGLKVSGNVEKVLNVLQHLQTTLHLDHMKGSLGDQIDIPSASRLKAILKPNFERLPNNSGIGDIELKNNTLRLPVITLNSNSEVVLRNLLAYESTSKMRSTKLRDYMDLICGIIKSRKDVTLLKDKNIKIIEGELPDEEIVQMCNRIKTSAVKKSNVHETVTKVNEDFNRIEKPADKKLDVHETVEQVNENFNKKAIVKACRSSMKCFAAIVKSINQIFPILVLLFLALQSFCEIHDCRRSSYGGTALRNSYLGELELDPKAKLMLPRKLYRY